MEPGRPVCPDAGFSGTPSEKRRGTAGSSLIELLVATLVLVIAFVGWLRISNFQAIRKESLRRAAIEKAAGFLDIMAKSGSPANFYRIDFTNGDYLVQASPTNGYIFPVFEEVNYPANTPIGYVLEVKWRAATNGWPNGRWAVVSLYDRHGITTNELTYGANSNPILPFSSMSIFMVTNTP